MGVYYDGTALLSQTDKRGLRPEIYICDTNRTGGKTTYFTKMLTNQWLKKRSKSMYIYRFKEELSDVDTKIYNDVSTLFFKKHTFDSVKRAKGNYIEILIDDEVCGYAVALNTSRNLKRYSHVFNDVNDMYFDEYQSEDNVYAKDEISKFISLHTSVARGQGKQVRYVRTILSGNMISVLNPYYDAFGVMEEDLSDRRFIKGNGWVLEKTLIESAVKAQEDSAFFQAIKHTEYGENLVTSNYLNDNNSFICSIPSAKTYYATLFSDGYYGVWMGSDGLWYVSSHCDKNYPILVSKDNTGATLGRMANEPSRKMLQKVLNFGNMRYENQKCKYATLKTLSY